MAPDAAYRLLKKVYSILTGKEVHDTIQEPPEEVPFYAKPTIAQKVKDHEIDRSGMEFVGLGGVALGLPSTAATLTGHRTLAAFPNQNFVAFPMVSGMGMSGVDFYGSHAAAPD